ncbi:unnamed protein product [Zymoseptoria tritici ST99CH_1A5]|uniref:Uncharacterized protein n=1 Tax=Zymoseptoria tritici ST99CH_1A5 TaxID=1276529 RepID=A0A1Y6LQ27_ZYMTR|nr:unnamed protein product [Zymoseptoria tritici ST99CH_1A5]
MDNQFLPTMRRRRTAYSEDPSQTGPHQDQCGPQNKPENPDMTLVWKRLPPEIASIIIVEVALTPLSINAHTYYRHDGANWQPPTRIEHIRALEPQKWQRVRNTLAVSTGIRRDVIRALNARGTIENWDIAHAHAHHSVPRSPRSWFSAEAQPVWPGDEVPPPSTQPSWWLLRHFRWLSTTVWDMILYLRRVPICIVVRFPNPGVLRRVEHVVVPTNGLPIACSDAEIEAFISSICNRAKSECYLFRTVGGWNMRSAIGDISDVRELIIYEADSSMISFDRNRLAREGRQHVRERRQHGSVGSWR